MPVISFKDKLIKSGSLPIHFVRCKDTEGQDCYFFLMCAHHKMQALKALPANSFDLKEYGKILASGYGKKPTQAIKDHMKRDYNFDADLLFS